MNKPYINGSRSVIRINNSYVVTCFVCFSGTENSRTCDYLFTKIIHKYTINSCQGGTVYLRYSRSRQDTGEDSCHVICIFHEDGKNLDSKNFVKTGWRPKVSISVKVSLLLSSGSVWQLFIGWPYLDPEKVCLVLFDILDSQESILWIHVSDFPKIRNESLSKFFFLSLFDFVSFYYSVRNGKKGLPKIRIILRIINEFVFCTTPNSVEIIIYFLLSFKITRSLTFVRLIMYLNPCKTPSRDFWDIQSSKRGNRL